MAMKFESDLIEFYGTECPHCMRMKPLIKQAEQELKVKVQSFEVWHNAENAKLLKEFDKGFCGGVPFFFNRKTKKWICGAVPYEEFKAWAQGK
jgi:thiol-disulfide isomerase/thioredoxin